MSHYFIDDNTLNREIRYIDYVFASGNTRFKFAVTDGVFSKNHVDYATDILLNAISEIPKNGSILDMGCGYGVIGIVLAKTYLLKLTQTDINRAAVDLTRRNCKYNNVNSEVFISDCFENITGKFDCIVINPPIHAGKSVTYRMYEDSVKYLYDGGKLYVVTFKKHGGESTLAKLKDVYGGHVNVIYKKKGIFVFECYNYGDRTITELKS